MVDGQAIPLRPVMPVVTFWAVHVVPASLVARISPFWPVGSEPTAQQSVVDGHAMASSTPVPAGTARRFQIAPPSVVPRMSPNPELLPPTT